MDRRPRLVNGVCKFVVASASLIWVMATGAHAASRAQVLTRGYNNQRTAANLSEKKLKPSNVNSSQFGKLFMLPVAFSMRRTYRF